MELTPQEIQLFRHNGFIRFPTQLSKDHVEALKAAALKDMEEGTEPVARQEGRIIRISAVWQRGGIFQETITCDEILNPLESLLGSNIEFVLNRHNHVYLRDAGSSHSLALHRDVSHWSRTIATVLIYLEDTIWRMAAHGLSPAHIIYLRSRVLRTKQFSKSLQTKRFRYRCQPAVCSR